MINPSFFALGGHPRRALCALAVFLAVAATSGGAAIAVPHNAADIQAILDRGDDVALDPHTTYELSATLRYKRAGQRIATRDVHSPADFAVLRVAPGPLMTAIDATGVAGASLEHVILDGNRRRLSPVDGKVPGVPFTAWGRAGADHQSVRECVIFDARSGGGWGAIHVNEGASDMVIENNIVVGSGVDCRGNGRAAPERAFGWGDGVSTAGRNTIVRNNLIVDATDDGIMLQGAPGSTVEGNVVSAVSRELLGGIVMIDPFAFYALPGDARRCDYRGVLVRRNQIEALGERIQIGVPMGGACWNIRLAGKTLVGATIVENTLAGEAFGYGFAADGIDGFVVRGNVSNATHSGRGDGPRGNPPDPAAPFLYNPATVGTSHLQPEFKAVMHHIHSLLRCWPPPADALGYRIAPYTDPELSAIVRMAFVEICGRQPNAQELRQWADWLRDHGANADALRVSLSSGSPDALDPKLSDLTAMQSFRIRRWEKALLQAWRTAQRAPGDDWPTAEALYADTLRGLATRP